MRYLMFAAVVAACFVVGGGSAEAGHGFGSVRVLRDHRGRVVRDEFGRPVIVSGQSFHSGGFHSRSFRGSGFRSRGFHDNGFRNFRSRGFRRGPGPIESFLRALRR